MDSPLGRYQAAMGDDTSNLSPVIRIGPGGGAPLRDITLGKKGLESRSEGVIKRCLRTRGDERVWKPATGTELEKKKSYHPELSALADTLGDDRRDVIVLREDPGKGDHKMELIHLNRTCTCVDLASSTKAAVTAPHPAAGTATTTRPATRPATRPRSSDDNLPGEEKVHRVRHEVRGGVRIATQLPPVLSTTVQLTRLKGGFPASRVQFFCGR